MTAEQSKNPGTAVAVATPEPRNSKELWQGFAQRPMTTVRRAVEYFAQRWQNSIQLRVIGSVLLASLLVTVILGFVLISFVGQQLLNTKYSAATEELDRARVAVEEQINSSDASNPVDVRLSSARAVLADRSGGVDQSSTAVYDPVLIARDVNDGETIAPPSAKIPNELRRFVQQGQVAYQYETFAGPGGSYKALVIGTPVSSEISGLELYLVMPLEAEETTLSLMRGLLTAGAIVLLVLLVVIAWVFSQQLTTPVRTASRIAERFAAGHLRERMVVTGNDEVARLAISFNDMAEKLSTQIRNLEEFGSLQRQFTSDVSHELRTPLTTVRMAADLINDNAENLDPLTARAAALMNKELDRFETLLGDLLEISRHDAGVANLSRERVDARGVVRSALAQVHVIAEEIGTTIEVNLPEEPVMVEIDSRRVERILRNLFANAVDHSEAKPIIVTMAVGKTALAVSVVDHGVGLKPGEEDLVFNRFWRSDPSRERRTGGTGLGLAIAQEDARLHGGRLEATGEPGVGACFRLTLPLVAGNQTEEAPLPLDIDRTFSVDAHEGAKNESPRAEGGVEPKDGEEGKA
ncbi:MtrAB system histidine kinase MtrB [Corynebacterium auriscanis]|uniref:Sensor histidine kinase MtrB n=1 Tax=Corynebacterium auriscanis TaxID=99807 RepID=A0A0A2DH56_9CORY|nr:histidine kinase [Corynebacterium auriscanis]WJY73383.1 Sensor histidine kinase MtrB [Corynebacterium auriscanis]